jgi:hypothetical protein
LTLFPYTTLFRSLPLEGSAQEAAWSPAGDRLAVKVSPRELVDDVLMKTRVVFVDAADGRAIGVAETPGKLGRMAWAPDGRHLGLIMAADPNDPREGRLAVVGASGGQPRDLLPGLEGHVWHLAWRNAQRLIYISYEGVAARLGEIGLDGRNDRTLAATGGPIWDALSVSEDGRTVALHREAARALGTGDGIVGQHVCEALGVTFSQSRKESLDCLFVQ